MYHVKNVCNKDIYLNIDNLLFLSHNFFRDVIFPLSLSLRTKIGFLNFQNMWQVKCYFNLFLINCLKCYIIYCIKSINYFWKLHVFIFADIN